MILMIWFVMRGIMKNQVMDKKYSLIYKLFKFSIVGLIATLIDFFLLILLKEVFRINMIFANTISFSISVIYNYIASIVWVFDVDKSKNKGRNLALFLIFSVLGLLINSIIMEICINTIKLFYIISKVIATIVTMIFNFITRKKFLE